MKAHVYVVRKRDEWTARLTLAPDVDYAYWFDKRYAREAADCGWFWSEELPLGQAAEAVERWMERMQRTGRISSFAGWRLRALWDPGSGSVEQGSGAVVRGLVSKAEREAGGDGMNHGKSSGIGKGSKMSEAEAVKLMSRCMEEAKGMRRKKKWLGSWRNLGESGSRDGKSGVGGGEGDDGRMKGVSGAGWSKGEVGSMRRIEGGIRGDDGRMRGTNDARGGEAGEYRGMGGMSDACGGEAEQYRRTRGTSGVGGSEVGEDGRMRGIEGGIEGNDGRMRGMRNAGGVKAGEERRVGETRDKGVREIALPYGEATKIEGRAGDGMAEPKSKRRSVVRWSAEGGRRAMDADRWNHAAAMAKLAATLLQGRALLSGEARALLSSATVPGEGLDNWREAFQLAALAGQVRLGGAVAAPVGKRADARRRLRCQRCGSGEAQLRRAACLSCGRDCAYCEACILMGRSRECELLIRGVYDSPVWKEHGLGRWKAMRGQNMQDRLGKWGLSPAQSDATAKALDYLEERPAARQRPSELPQRLRSSIHAALSRFMPPGSYKERKKNTNNRGQVQLATVQGALPTQERAAQSEKNGQAVRANLQAVAPESSGQAERSGVVALAGANSLARANIDAQAVLNRHAKASMDDTADLRVRAERANRAGQAGANGQAGATGQTGMNGQAGVNGYARANGQVIVTETERANTYARVKPALSEKRMVQPLDPGLANEGDAEALPSISFHENNIDNQAPERRFLIWAVTGAGKTEMVFPLVESVISRGGRACIASPRRDVVLELDPRIRKAFPECSVVTLYGGSEQRWDRGEITLSTTHQLIRFHEAFDLVIIDELDAFPFHGDPMLHYAAAKSRLRGAPTLLLSATPPSELQRDARRGKLAHARVPVRYHRHPLPVPKLLSSPSVRQLLAKGRVPRALMQALQQSLGRGAQVFLFVQRISESEPMAALLRKQWPAIAIEATSSQDPHRADKVTRFRGADTRLLVTTTILERGVTIPRSDVFILDADGQLFDEASLVQMAGRAGRSADDPAGRVYFVAVARTLSQLKAVRHIKGMNRTAAQRGFLLPKPHAKRGNEP